jgi:hypothetical protein
LVERIEREMGAADADMWKHTVRVPVINYTEPDASSGSTARSPAIFSQDYRPHHGHHGRIRGKRAARRGRRAMPSASDVRERVVEFAKGLLRLDGTQCKNEAERDNDEPDPPHGHLGEGWLAGV